MRPMIKKYFLFSFLILLLVNCAGIFKKERPKPTESAEDIAENYVSDAIDYYQVQKYREAIQGWKQALQIIPDDAEVDNFIGLAYHRLGKLDSAIIYFEKAVEIDTLYHQAWNNLGYMHFLLGEYKQALVFFDQALRVNPFYEQARLNRTKTAEILDGTLKIQAFELVEKTDKIDSLELQIANYRKALEIDSNYVDAWNNLGVSYYYYGNLDSAVICLKRALDKKPDYPPAHNNVAYLLDAMGDYDQAIVHYQKAIQLRPNYLIAMANLVDTYVHKKDYESARTILNSLRQLDPQNSLVRERIEDYRELLYGNTPQGGQ
jgi:tetratricopeptide (TPR) repeat protein